LKAWPAADRRAIVCQDDRLVDIGWARRTLSAELAVTPAELPGGHSPFLSRPAALAEALVAGRP
jgi:hypothetical protein